MAFKLSEYLYIEIYAAAYSLVMCTRNYTNAILKTFQSLTKLSKSQCANDRCELSDNDMLKVYFVYKSGASTYTFCRS